MHYIIAMLGGLVMGVYWDAAKNKIGKVSGEAGPYNFSAARWALLSALVVPGLLYLTKRNQLLARAAEHPVEAGHARRNKAIIACAAGFLVFALSLGGESGNVALVKGGVLGANKTTTVGEALDNYGFFRSCKWESGKTANGMEFVNAAGELDLGQIPKWDILRSKGHLSKMEEVFQFTVNRDGTFELTGFIMRVTTADGKAMKLEEWTDLLRKKEGARMDAHRAADKSAYTRSPEAADEWEAYQAAAFSLDGVTALNDVYANRSPYAF